MRRTVVLVVASVLATLLASGVATTQTAGGPPDRFIVVLEDRVQNPGEVAQNVASRNGAGVGFVYRNTIKGFSATIPNDRVAEVRAEGVVDYVERDGTVRAVAQTLPWGIDRVDADASSTLAGNGSGAVSGVNAYVIDTGIDSRHADLNVVRHVNFAGGKNTDCDGHGTHVAGTVAARDNASAVVGVAPGAPLTGVKVLGCNGSGTTSGVIAGVDWVTQNAKLPAVANMSLGGGVSVALDDAVRRSAASGVFYSLAAGNDSLDACLTSPARAGTTDGIMTTAATDSGDGEALFSNFGSCVDVWAPGVDVLSTRRGGGTTTFSGTSMAAPHVGGGGALYLSRNAGASPASVENALKADSRATGTMSKDTREIRLLNVGGY